MYSLQETYRKGAKGEERPIEAVEASSSGNKAKEEDEDIKPTLSDAHDEDMEEVA